VIIYVFLFSNQSFKGTDIDIMDKSKKTPLDMVQSRLRSIGSGELQNISSYEVTQECQQISNLLEIYKNRLSSQSLERERCDELQFIIDEMEKVQIQ
jgi:hypothetical protein